METIIYNHDELKRYLKEHEWIEESSNVFRYPHGEGPYVFKAFINPFEERTFFLYGRSPYTNTKKLVFFEMGGREYPAIKEIKKETKRFLLDYLEWKEDKIQKETIKKAVQQLIDTKVRKDENGYYIPFNNGIDVHIFLLPNDYGFEVSYPSNKLKKKYATRRYEFTEEDMTAFTEMLQRKGNEIPYLSGWVTPVEEEKYRSSYDYRTFDNAEGKAAEKAREFRDLYLDILEKDYYYHVIRFIYNDKKDEEAIEIEVSTSRDYLEGYREDIINVLKELTEEYSFLKHDSTYSYMDVYSMPLQSIEDKLFKKLMEELNNRLEEVVKRK